MGTVYRLTLRQLAGRWRLAIMTVLAAMPVLIALLILHDDRAATVREFATAVLGAMLAEFLMGTNGLGALFSESRSYSEMERAWGTALVATVLSVLVFLAARVVERRVDARVT